MNKIKFILSLFLLSLLLVSCAGNNQELKKEEVEKEIKKEKNIEEKLKKDYKLEKFNEDIKKISFNELNNSLYSNLGGEKLKDKIQILSSSGQTLVNRQKASFLQSFLGDYKNAIDNRKKLCKEDTKLDFCKKINLKLTSYRPTDIKGNILKDVKISIDGIEKGNLKGNNDFDIENKFIHRIKVSKEGYLDYYKKVFIDDNSFRKESLNPKLRKADLEKIINSNKEENIKTNNFDFYIGKNSFIAKNGKKYSGKVKIYAFDIGENDGDLNVLNLDAFDKDGNYVGNSMVTFGMPLIKVYDLKGNELKISKGIIGKGKIQNKQKAPGINLEEVPKNKWLSKIELEKYNIPPFWYLDQNNGIWKETQMKILDSKGNYEFKLY